MADEGSTSQPQPRGIHDTRVCLLIVRTWLYSSHPLLLFYPFPVVCLWSAETPTTYHWARSRHSYLWSMASCLDPTLPGAQPASCFAPPVYSPPWCFFHTCSPLALVCIQYTGKRQVNDCHIYTSLHASWKQCAAPLKRMVLQDLLVLQRKVAHTCVRWAWAEPWDGRV